MSNHVAALDIAGCRAELYSEVMGVVFTEVSRGAAARAAATSFDSLMVVRPYNKSLQRTPLRGPFWECCA